MQNIESRSQINSWTPGCNVCEKQEAAGQPSFRQSSFDIVPKINSNLPVALDINIDKTCNAACVICGPYASSLWAKYSSKKNDTIYIKPSNNLDDVIEGILENLDLSELRRIKFFGGEPLLTDTHLKILNRIPYPEKVDIWYTTNASILPKQNVLQVWERFKIIFFEASIDAVDTQFEYIRWPLKWKHIEQNLLSLKSSGTNNILFRINHTLNPFNIFYYEKLDSWIQEYLPTNRLGDVTEINIHPCWGVWGLEKTPSKLRDQVYNKYPNHLISNILALHPETSYSSILDFTKEWDPIRKFYWQDVFPEIVDYFP